MTREAWFRQRVVRDRWPWTWREKWQKGDQRQDWPTDCNTRLVMHSQQTESKMLLCTEGLKSPEGYFSLSLSLSINTHTHTHTHTIRDRKPVCGENKMKDLVRNDHKPCSFLVPFSLFTGVRNLHQGAWEVPHPKFGDTSFLATVGLYYFQRGL